MEKIYDTLSTRNAFGHAVLTCMQNDPNMIAIAPDTGKSMGFDEAAAAFPARVFNVGIAEQNMVNMAAGIAATGDKAIIGTYAPFLTLRALEQVRTFICYPNLPVVMGGAMAGLSGGIEGPTHQSVEDIAIMRSLPNMQVVVPADAHSTYELTCQAEKTNLPVYVRLGRYLMPKVYNENESFVFGKAKRLRQGSDVSILCCGTMVFRSLQAAEELESVGIHVSVVDIHTIKPLDAETVLSAALTTGAIVTAEEHSVFGGLGAAVAEFLSEVFPVPIIRVGIEDTFAESADQETLMDAYGLSVQRIVQAALKAMALKRR